MARSSRIYVEGRHDAELIAQVWGEDLRIEGVVVEYLGGVDDLVGIVEEFRPEPRRRLGVLVDHLVSGSKEARIAEAVRRGPGGPDTLVVGHPYVDIWQAVKPQRLGLAAWPTVPRHIEWKRGACRALGLPHAYSGHNSYAEWGPPPEVPAAVIAVGYRRAELRQWFGSVEQAARIDNGVGLRNSEQGAPVWVCRQRLAPWSTLWPRLRHIG